MAEQILQIENVDPKDLYGPNDKYPKVKPQLTAEAGSDLFMPGCKKDLENMLKGLEDGSVTREQLQINATRVYRMGNLLNQ